MALPYATEQQLNLLKKNIESIKVYWEAGEGSNSVKTINTGCEAIGEASVAEGLNTLAESDLSHAEGSHTIAKGACSHAEGSTTESMGMYSHAEGSGTISGGRSSHAEGDGTITENVGEHAEGSYNKSHSIKNGDFENTISSVGIGDAIYNRKNAFEIMQNGDAYLLGVGGYDGTNPEHAITLQDSISAGGGESSLISVVLDQPLYSEMNWFQARIGEQQFPDDFLSDMKKYNLIAVISGVGSDTFLYTANHFCLHYEAAGGNFMSVCYDTIPISPDEAMIPYTDGDITHMTTLTKQPDQDQFVLKYRGLSGTTPWLPIGALTTVSIYLQRMG